MRKAPYIFAIALAGILIISGCSKKFKMHRESLQNETSWQYHHADLNSRGNKAGSFNGNLNVIWEESFGTRPSGPITLAKGLLILPESRKKIRFYETASGKYRGYLRTKGITGTGLLVKDSLGFYIDGPRQYVLRCINLLKRDIVWETKVKDATSGSIIVGNNVIFSFTEGTILAYDLNTGENSWSYQAEERFLAPPSAVGEFVFQPGDKGNLYCINAVTGQEEGIIELGGPILAAAPAHSYLFTVNMDGKITATEPVENKTVWTKSVKGPVWSSPAVDDHQIYITSNSGVITAFDKSSGAEVWKYIAGEVLYSSPIVVGNQVVFGTMTGKLYSLNSSSGAVIGTRQLSGAVSTHPVSDGRFIYVATDDGELLCLGDSNEIAALGK